MPATVTVDRSPDQLTDDLTALTTVDWGQVWAGEVGNAPDRWVEHFGWRLERIGPEEHLAVTLPSGADLTLFRQMVGVGIRFEEAWVTVWQSRAARADDNDAVTAAAVATWPGYLAAAQTALGPAIPLASDGQLQDPNTPPQPVPASQAGEHAPPAAVRWALADQAAIVTLEMSMREPHTSKRPKNALIRVVVTPSAASR